MAPSTIVFPKQGFVELRLVKAKTSRGTRERLVQSKKQSKRRPQTPPPPVQSSSVTDSRKRKQRRCESDVDEPHAGPSSRIHDETTLGYDGFPVADNGDEGSVNPDVFRARNRTSTQGKVDDLFHQFSVRTL